MSSGSLFFDGCLLVVFCCRDDDDDIHGNPLVAGFQDLAPDDEVKTTSEYHHRPVTNSTLHAELPSDDETSTAVLRPKHHKDSLSEKSGGGTAVSVVRPAVEGSSVDQMMQNASVETTTTLHRGNPTDRDVAVDSSEEEMLGSGVVVRADEDVSAEDRCSELQQRLTGSSTAQVGIFNFCPPCGSRGVE